MARRLATVALVVLLALVAGTGSASAFPDVDQGFGYNVQSLVRATKPGQFVTAQWPTYLGLMTQDGLHVARTDALWGKAEPNAPAGGVHTYDWSTDDTLVTVLAQQGVRWDAVLGGTPKWAGVTTSGFAAPKPERYADFFAYAGAFAARYGVGGTFWSEHPGLPALPVQRMEIWNEPNTSVHWGTTPDPAAYASLFVGAQAAIKAAAPQTTVSVGGIVWNDDVAFIDGFLSAIGPSVTVDGLGSHPYAPTAFSLMANVVRVRKALDDAGRPTVPLDINELGWPAAYDRAPAAHALDGPVADASRAATMSLTIDSLADSTCDVGDLIVYDLVEPEDDPAHVESLMGLYRRSGSATLTSAAYAGAVARYRGGAGANPPVPVCGARGATATRVLPLRLAAVPATGGCAAVTVTYRGLPLEEAQVRLLSPGRGPVPTDAAGTATICHPSPASAAEPLRIEADVPGVAASNVMLCRPTGCRRIDPAAACATSNLAVVAGQRAATVLRRGLRLQTSACNPQIGSPVRMRVSLVLSRAAARRAGLAADTTLVSVGRGSARLAPGGAALISARLNAAGRRALRRVRTLGLTVKLTAVENATKDVTTRKVTLRR